MQMLSASLVGSRSNLSSGYFQSAPSMCGSKVNQRLRKSLYPVYGVHHLCLFTFWQSPLTLWQSWLPQTPSLAASGQKDSDFSSRFIAALHLCHNSGFLSGQNHNFLFLSKICLLSLTLWCPQIGFSVHLFCFCILPRFCGCCLLEDWCVKTLPLHTRSKASKVRGFPQLSGFGCQMVGPLQSLEALGMWASLLATLFSVCEHCLSSWTISSENLQCQCFGMFFFLSPAQRVGT